MEFKRILLGKPFVLLMIVLLLISTYFFVYKKSVRDVDFFRYGDIYDEFLTEYSGLSFDEALARCEEYKKRAVAEMMAGTWENDRENSIRLQVAEKLCEQYSHIATYRDYLSGIQKRAESLQGVSLFSDKGSFAYKNTVKTANDFSALSDVTLTAGHDLAVTEVFGDSWTDIISLIPVFLVCGLFLSERKKGLDVLVRATPAGRCKFTAKRIIILFLASAVTVTLLFGTKILLNGYYYHGLGEWGRSLQSIPMFYNVPYPLTIGGFWLLFLAIKTLGVFLAGATLWLIQSVVSNTAAAVGAAGVFAGVEFACTAIPSSSFFAVFRYVNIFNYINYIPAFTKYLNLPIFGFAVSGNILSCALLPLLCCLVLFLVLYISKTGYPVRGKKGLPVKLGICKAKFDGAFAGGGLFLKELKKLLVYRRGIFVLILLIVLLTQTGVPLRDESPSDMYLQYYEEKYSGPVTDATPADLREELSAAEEPYRIAALKQLIAEVERAPDGAWIVPSAPYEALLTPQKYHYTIALISLLFLILLVSPVNSQERQSETVILLNSTPAGRGKLRATKQAVVFGCAFAVWLIVYGSELIKLTDAYGRLSCFGAPLSSLSGVHLFEGNISIGMTLVLIYALRLAVLLAVAEICFALSSICGKNSNAVILNCSVIVIPSSLAAIGSFVGEKLSLLMPLTVVDIAPDLYPYLIILAAFVVAFVFSNRSYGIRTVRSG